MNHIFGVKGVSYFFYEIRGVVHKKTTISEAKERIITEWSINN